MPARDIGVMILAIIGEAGAVAGLGLLISQQPHRGRHRRPRHIRLPG
jgi:hypothetical protein